MKKSNVYLLAVFFILFFLLTINSQAATAPIKVAIVFDKGGKDDKSFNQSAYEGAMKAKKDLGIELKYVEATDLSAQENLHRAFAKKDYDLIIGIGFSQTEAVKKVAAQFPQKKFAIVDANVEAPNVRTLLFEEHEGSYLVGAIAALKSKTAKVGFIGGMDIPLIRRFEMGYDAGVKKVSSSAKVVSNFIGVTEEAWVNPAKAKELALAQYAQGVDVIFIAAGASNSGAFDAAEEKGKLAIGVDSNQDWMKPGFILTSMLKRVDIAVYDTIKLANEGKFSGGVIRYGLKDKGIDFSVDQYNQKVLTPEILAKVEPLKKEIIAGKLSVPDYYKKSKK